MVHITVTLHELIVEELKNVSQTESFHCVDFLRLVFTRHQHKPRRKRTHKQVENASDIINSKISITDRHKKNGHARSSYAYAYAYVAIFTSKNGGDNSTSTGQSTRNISFRPPSCLISREAQVLRIRQ